MLNIEVSFFFRVGFFLAVCLQYPVIMTTMFSFALSHLPPPHFSEESLYISRVGKDPFNHLKWFLFQVHLKLTYIHFVSF